MNDVKRARNGGHTDATGGQFAPNRRCQRRLDLIGHTWHASAGQVELDRVDAVPGHRVERFGQRWPHERLGKDADPHRIALLAYTPPETSASCTASPASTERAIATIARMAAIPSSMPAPCWGTPCRIVSAKPSIWSL